MGKAKEKPKKYEERLMDALAFDEDDLEANQAGYFSQEQITRLKAARNSAIFEFMLLLLLCMVLSVIFIGVGMGATNALPPLIAGSLVASALYFTYGSKAHLLLKDLRENQISTAEGRVDLSLTPKQNNADYSILVEKMRFRIKKKEAFLAFKNGDPYRIYYAPHSKRILSVEWLRENDNLLETQSDSALAELDLIMDDLDISASAK